MKRLIFLLLLALPVAAADVALAATLSPGEAVDYKPMAFNPERWTARGLSTMLIPWDGEAITFFTTSADLDRATMAVWVNRLDEGWKLYGKLTGRQPRSHKQFNGRTPIAAIPDIALSCGTGCGFVGATGIELAKFYSEDYRMVKGNPKAMPHYVFYEMGRNYYTFGDRHSLFITGYAVFMRYVCMDTLACEDPDLRTRTIIESAEENYAGSEVAFIDAFTEFGGKGEKGNRLKQADGKPLAPSDQPVMYATAMLKLWKQYGGNEWLQAYYRHLARCPAVKPDSQEAALRQSLNWLVAASCAAGEDLTPIFVDRWRMPMSAEARRRCAAIDWKQESIDAGAVVRQLAAP